MRSGKAQNSVGQGQGRNQMPNRNQSHLSNDGQLRAQQAAFPIQGVIMQRQFMPGHQQMAMSRGLRPSGRYSSSPQGPGMHYPNMPQQQNMGAYGISPQEQFSMARQYMAPVHTPQVSPYSMPSTSYQHYVQQPNPAYYQTGMPTMYYVTQQQQQQQQPQQQQQQQQPATHQQQQSAVNTPLPGANISKPVERQKPKRSNKITIKDPKDNKDITEEILSHATNHSTPSSNGKSTGTPPLSSSSSVQTDSSTIQAAFAAQVAAAVGSRGEKGHEKRHDEKEETKPQPSQSHVEHAAKTNENVPEAEKNNGNKESAADDTLSPQIPSESNEEGDEGCAICLDTNSTDLPEINTDKNKVEILTNEKRTATVKINEQQFLMVENVDLTPNIHTDLQPENIQLEPKVSKADEESEMRNGFNEINNEAINNEAINNEAINNEAINNDSSKGEMTSHSVGTDSHEESPIVGEQLKSDLATQKMDYTESKGENVDCPQNEVLSEELTTDNTELSHTDISEEPETNKCSEVIAAYVDLETDISEESITEEKEYKVEQKHVTDHPDSQQINNMPLQQQEILKTGDPPPKKKTKQRFKDFDKKESEGSLMDAYVDKPAPEPVIQEKVKAEEVLPKKVEKPSDEDLSWEDKGEKIGDEIKIEKESETEAISNEQTKLKYERDFLLQFQFMQMCTEKPAGLPDIEVVLDAPVPQNKMVAPRGSAMPDFLPSYARQKSQSGGGGGGGGGGRNNSRGKAQPRKIITPVQQSVELKKSDNRWTRAQEKEVELSEEEKKTAELYRIVIAILNKLTPQKFKTLISQIMQLEIDTAGRLEGVIDRIFEKAISEPVFSVAYANMCRCLLTIKVSGPDDKDVTFRKLLLNRCQKEFEKEGQAEKALEEQENQLEGLSEEEKKIKREAMNEEAMKNKRRMLGNIKFIGELFKLKLLTDKIMHDCIFKLLRAGDMESLESMSKLLSTIGKDLDSDKAKPRMQQYFDQINKIITSKKVSSRVTFMLRDVVDLRKNNWIPRREENYNPKTIDQIHKEHKEAQMERSQEQRNVSLPKETSKQKKGGGRDSPKPNQSSNDGWIVSGRGGKPAPIDTNKIKSINKRANADDKISLGPSGRPLGAFSQWGRGSTGGLGNSGSAVPEPELPANRYSALSAGDNMPSNRPYDPRKSGVARPSSAGSRTSDKRQGRSDRDSAIEAARSFTTKTQMKTEVPQSTSNVEEKPETQTTKEIQDETPSLSIDEMAKKTKAIVDEFVNIEDLGEALRCFADLKSPEIHYVFVMTAVEQSYESNSKGRQVIGRLLNELLSQKKLDKGQFRIGLSNALENAEDNAIDYPKLWCYLAEIITPILLGEQFQLADLKPLIMHLVECNKAAVLLAEILTIIAKDNNADKAIQFWTNSNINWLDVLANDVSIHEFLQQKNLTFLPNEIDELNKLLREDVVNNDTVFTCIEKKFKEEKRKEPEFISQLASAVAESCLINKGEIDGPDCCSKRLKERKNILHKYLDNNHDLELEVLFALQTLYVQHNKPGKMLLTFFNTLYDEEVITEESFFSWKNDNNPSRQEAKGPALQATTSFFEWLLSAAEENHDS